MEEEYTLIIIPAFIVKIKKNIIEITFGWINKSYTLKFNRNNKN